MRLSSRFYSHKRLQHILPLSKEGVLCYTLKMKKNKKPICGLFELLKDGLISWNMIIIILKSKKE